jgi:Eukaryotic protein of unknown function (DUF866)
MFSSLSTDVVKGSYKEYHEDDSGKFKTIVSFVCKGIEPSEFSFEVCNKPLAGIKKKLKRNNFQDGWEVKVLEQSTVFENVNLSEEWVEYDPKSQMPVGISEIKSQFVREQEK